MSNRKSFARSKIFFSNYDTKVTCSQYIRTTTTVSATPTVSTSTYNNTTQNNYGKQQLLSLNLDARTGGLPTGALLNTRDSALDSPIYFRGQMLPGFTYSKSASISLKTITFIDSLSKQPNDSLIGAFVVDTFKPSCKVS